MERRKTCTFVGLGLAALLCLSAGPAPEWEVKQITSCATGISTEPRLSADGTRILFLSSCDPAGKNSDRSVEIFEASPGRVTQLTSGSFCQVFDHEPAPDGQRVAFLSNCPYGGRNQDQGIELMLRDRKGEVTVLTRSRGAKLEDLVWSADGRYLYFVSTGNYTQENDDNSREIFLADTGLAPAALRQVTKTTKPHGCGSPTPVPGAVLAICDDDFIETVPPDAPRGLPTVIAGKKPGGNPDFNPELMSFSLEGQILQLTYTVGCRNYPPVAGANGRLVALISQCNLPDQKKPGNGSTLYLYYGRKFTQAIPGLMFEPRDLTASGDGTSLAFCAGLAADRQNHERNLEVFVLRLNELHTPRPARSGFPNGLHLVSDFPSGATARPGFSADGRTMTFAATGNIDRQNQDGGFEIFVAHQARAARAPALDGENDEDTVDEPEEPEEPEVEEGESVEAGDTVEIEDEPEEESEEELEPLPVEEPILPPGLLP